MQWPMVQNRIHMRNYSLFWFKFYRCPPAHLRYSHLRSVESNGSNVLWVADLHVTWPNHGLTMSSKPLIHDVHLIRGIS